MYKKDLIMIKKQLKVLKVNILLGQLYQESKKKTKSDQVEEHPYLKI